MRGIGGLIVAKTYRTPGVYVQEISTLPGTVAEVQSAIPAFIGYTEKTRYDGRALKGIPERIASLKDFEERFGGTSKVYLDKISVTTSAQKRFSQVDSVSFSKRFLLYESIYMYFINGGGECYVVSIGTFEENESKPSYEPVPFLDAIDSLNMVDEITLIVMPEAVLLGDSLYSVQQKALSHCATAMSRFAILDIKEEIGQQGKEKSILLHWENIPGADSWTRSYKEFRDKIGVMNLSYGAAYTPYIIADTPTNFGYKDIKDRLVDVTDNTKKLCLSDLDPVAYDAVKYLDSAIKDHANLLGAISFAKKALVGGNTSNDNISLGEAIAEAFTNKANKMNIANIGEVLSGLLGSLGSSFASQGTNPEALQLAQLVEAFNGDVENLKTAIEELFNVESADFSAQKDKALQELGICLEAAKDIKSNNIKDIQAELSKIKTALDGLTEKDAEKEATLKVEMEAAFVKLEKAFDSSANPEQAGSNFPKYPLSDELVRHIRDSIAQLIPTIAILCEPNTAGTDTSKNTDVFAQAFSFFGQIKKENFFVFANIVDGPLSTNISETINKNITRLSDGLFGTSAVYRCIHAALQKALRVQPVSASMAGLYAATDNSRGVWKAPANISVSNCLSLTQTITSHTQEELNIDSVAGKSINAVRSFPGKGYLVWGARTLDGNSQEWRYIPVRRFFIMVEESVRRATTASVFEPNDANLWMKVKALIDNYLLQKWKDGALMGASASEGYFVNIGLGATMTEQDILDGRLIVDIGMAVVRPAEFIILRFMHKMQQ